MSQKIRLYALPSCATPKIIVCLVSTWLAATATLILWKPPALTWHDSQRLCQILLFTIFVAVLFLGQGLYRKITLINRFSGMSISALMLLGILSALGSRQPAWALAEVALITSCLGLAWGIAVARRLSGEILDKILIASVALLGMVKITEFSILYFTSLAAAEKNVDAFQILTGFSNPRFYGQFLSLTLPLLAMPLLARDRSYRYAILTFVVLTLWWTIAITSGTRGTWLGLFTAISVLFFTGSAGRRWAAWQAAGALIGLACFWILLTLIPEWLGVDVQNHASTRMTTSLSAREVIWLQAWEMIRERPLLGYGPMHFSDIPNPVAAHPHQAALQWGAEWGVPSLLGVTLLIAYAAWATLKVLCAHARSSRPTDLLRLCLSGSLLAALAQAMVDGVIVMPYTQVWLSILAGWLLALHPSHNETTTVSQTLRKAWLYACIASAALLLMISKRDTANLHEQQLFYTQDVGEFLQPRFWTQGVIAEGIWQKDFPNDPLKSIELSGVIASPPSPRGSVGQSRESPGP